MMEYLRWLAVSAVAGAWMIAVSLLILSLVAAIIAVAYLFISGLGGL